MITRITVCYANCDANSSPLRITQSEVLFGYFRAQSTEGMNTTIVISHMNQAEITC